MTLKGRRVRLSWSPSPGKRIAKEGTFIQTIEKGDSMFCLLRRNDGYVETCPWPSDPRLIESLGFEIRPDMVKR